MKNLLFRFRKTLDESEWSSCAKSGEISFLQSQIALDAAAAAGGGRKDPSDPAPGESGGIRSKDADDESKESDASLRIQLKELKMELERRNADLSEAEMSKKSLQVEVANLKKVIDAEEDDDDDTDSESEVPSSTKQLILSRDRQIERLESEVRSARDELRASREEAVRTKKQFEAEMSHWLDEKEKVIRYQKQLQLNYVQMYKRNKTLEGEMEALNKQLESEKERAEAAEAKAEAAEAKAAAAAAATPSASAAPAPAKVKKSNSVRAKLFKMSLYSESHC